jgi:hypothetical protein
VNIEWTQVIIALLIGVFASTAIKGLFAGLKSKVGG